MNRLILSSCLVVGCIALWASSLHAQLGIGAVGTPMSENCSVTGKNFYGANCFKTTITGCQNTQNGGITVDFGYFAPTSGTPQGVIVLFAGGAGEDPTPEGENFFAQSYIANGYSVVEVSWEAPWEATQGTHGDSAYGIRYAACWPATLLNYIYASYVVPMRQPSINPRAGMCAQGFSGGSGAVGYALAWYGGGVSTSSVPLDKVELLSGPVFSDIKQGCVEPVAQPQEVCGNSPSWCQLGTPPNYQPPWSDAPTYQDPVTNGVRLWANDNTCASSELVTTLQSNANWLNMSIVNQTSGVTLSYPNTKVTGWLCANVYQNAQSMNNSSAQGQIFFDAVANAEGANAQLAVYAVQNCDTNEGVNSLHAFVPALPTECDVNGQNCGFTAIVDDMSTTFSQTGACKH